MNLFARFLANAFRAAVVTSALLLVTSDSRAEFLVPDSSTLPFQDWTRATPNSVYAQWEQFTVPFGGAGNAPDVGSYPTSGSPSGSAALIYGNESSAFLTGGGNIYSFAAATDFTAIVPSYGNGAGWNTRFVAQLRTLGNLLDLDSVQLTYSDGTDNHTVAPIYYDELYTEAQGGFGGALVDHLFVFDINGYDPSSAFLDFNATSSSMSLDRVAIDTFTSTSALTPVPEPAAAVLLALGLGAFGLWRWRLARKSSV